MSSATHQPLNPVDRAMLAVDRSLRSSGYPGFQTQMLLWLGERVDMDLLRRAARAFVRRHPLVAARLVTTPVPHWKCPPLPSLEVNEVDLVSPDDDAMLQYAAKVLATPREPTESDPLRLDVVHRPGGRDAILLQYTHVLLDNNATPRVIQELNALAHVAPKSQVSDCPRGNLIWQYLRRFPIDRRRKAARTAILHWRQDLQYGARMLGRPHVAGPPDCYRLASATLDEQQTSALRSRTTDACGLPAVSMAILAAAFRAIAPLTSSTAGETDRLVAGIGVDLNLRSCDGPLFQNLMSLVLIQARLQEVGSWDGLVRTLQSRLRDQLQQGLDLGILRQTTVMSRRPRALHWGIHHFLRHTCSLWYAYFGSLDQIGPTFCGAAIDQVGYFGPAWPPLGVTLLASTYRGRLTLGLTSVPASVPDQRASGFLDAVLHDLREAAEARLWQR